MGYSKDHNKKNDPVYKFTKTHGHFILRVNTPVKFGRYRKGLTLVTVKDGRKVYFEYNAGNMQMSADQYIELIASSQRTELKGLSEIDQKGVQDGKAYIGMSKEGVRMALGYPAPHRTPSLESSTWIYWRNRWKTRVVEFGTDQRAKNIRP